MFHNPIKPILKPRSNPSLAPYYFPLKTLFHLEMCLVFMKMCENCLQKLLSCFEDILKLSNITEDNRRQIASVSVSLSLSYTAQHQQTLLFCSFKSVQSSFMRCERQLSQEERGSSVTLLSCDKDTQMKSLDWQTAYFIQCKNTQLLPTLKMFILV